MFTISLSLVITSIYPCPSLYANVKCRIRDNTSPFSHFGGIIAYDHADISKVKIANLKETRKQNGWIRFFFSPRRETETLFFYVCSFVLLSKNLKLKPSCWHIGHMFFDNLLVISSGRAVFGSLSLLIAVAAIRSEQQIRKWRAYCDPCTTTVFISDDRHPHEWPPRSNFSYNSHERRRKHTVLGMKLNPLSLLFQLATCHLNNTNKRLKQWLSYFSKKPHVFSSYMCIYAHAGVMVRERILFLRLWATRVFRIFVMSAQLINREYFAFSSVKLFQSRLNS